MLAVAVLHTWSLVSALAGGAGGWCAGRRSGTARHLADLTAAMHEPMHVSRVAVLDDTAPLLEGVSANNSACERMPRAVSGVPAMRSEISIVYISTL